jgi:hypothetical protein
MHCLSFVIQIEVNMEVICWNTSLNSRWSCLNSDWREYGGVSATEGFISTLMTES